ncbi:MAG: hypothetical protein ACK41O_10080 [Runella zeae]|jgi:hypothetical protein
MNWVRYTLVMWVGWLFTNGAWGQIAIPHAKSKMSLPSTENIRQIDEFYDRFNAYRLANGQKISDSLRRTSLRAELIRGLINAEDTKWHKPEEREKLSRFIKLVCDENKPRYLEKFDDKIYAIASCKVEYFSSPSTTDLLFRRKVEKGTHSWLLQGVSDDFMVQFEKKTEQRAVVPNAHETNFLSLSNELHAGVPLRNYTDTSFRFDALSAFVFAVDNKFVKFNECDRVTVFVTGIEGWIIKLEEYTRENTNSGWLISDLIETKQETTQALIFKYK